MDTLRGILKNTTFRNPQNGWSVLKIESSEHTKTIAVTGSLPDFQSGETLEFIGSWSEHPKFGKQFLAQSYKVIPPESKEGLIRYLSSGLFRGVGLATAEKLVAHFGIGFIDIMDQTPGRIKEFKGFGEKKREDFLASWEDNQQSRGVMYFLNQHQVSPGVAAKIWQKYGAESIHVIQENPYVLADEIWGIGFFKADTIARNLGLPAESNFRLQSGLLHVLAESMREGHVFLPRQELLRKSWQILKLDGSDDLAQLLVLCLDGLIATSKIISEKEDCYLPWLYHYEKNSAQVLLNLLASPNKTDPKKLMNELLLFEKTHDLEYSEEQKEIIRTAVTHRLFVLTGGPGTGKTTTLQGILYLLDLLEKKTFLAAPTGRAAKRMSELCGKSASTLHRLLEFQPQEGSFNRNQGNPLDADYVIIDEVSMVDTLLMHALCDALPSHCSLLLIGDQDQLPSVGPGNVLRELLSCEKVPAGTLTRIFRQAETSDIAINAARINNGKMPDTREGTHFHQIPFESSEQGLELLIRLVKHELPKKYGCNPLGDIQVLTPMHKGLLGTQSLNEALQEALNPEKISARAGGNLFKPGDRVMQLKNNYDVNVFNGDIGFLESINQTDKTLRINFENNFVNYDFAEADQIGLSYATTIHKSQGSEYPFVVVVLDGSHYTMLQRNLLYTAITRAREHVFLIANTPIIGTAVRNNQISKRYTRLSQWLSGEKYEEFLSFLEE
jgi:exodeoxyribonuclease V alpha subunit